MAQPWVIELTAVAATGDIQQLYPVFSPAGIAKASAVFGDLIRRPTEGKLHSLQVEQNGDAGTIELWDINGADAGADVSSAADITNAELTTLINSGKARLIWTRDITASLGADTVGIGQFRTFAKGLAARFSNGGPTGTCTLNMVVDGGYRLNETAG